MRVTRNHPHRAAATRPASAHATLAGMMTALGADGLVAAAALPGLLAEIDQHTAAVIAALCDSGHPLGPVALAGYACGVRDTVTERGWQAPDPRLLDWSRADWATVRLVAVCHIARMADYA